MLALIMDARVKPRHDKAIAPRLPYIATRHVLVLPATSPDRPCPPMLTPEHPPFYEHEDRAMRRAHPELQ